MGAEGPTDIFVYLVPPSQPPTALAFLGAERPDMYLGSFRRPLRFWGTSTWELSAPILWPDFAFRGNFYVGAERPTPFFNNRDAPQMQEVSCTMADLHTHMYAHIHRDSALWLNDCEFAQTNQLL